MLHRQKDSSVVRNVHNDVVQGRNCEPYGHLAKRGHYWRLAVVTLEFIVHRVRRCTGSLAGCARAMLNIISEYYQFLGSPDSNNRQGDW